MDLPGIPQSIARSKVVDLITSLGIDPNEITEDGVTLGCYSVTVDVYSTRDGTHRYANDDGTVAIHSITIPVDQKD